MMKCSANIRFCLGERRHCLRAYLRCLSLFTLIGTCELSISSKAAFQGFTDLDQVGEWRIERKITADGEITCRAYLPSGGTWFSANIHLNQSDQIVIPGGMRFDETTALEKLIRKLKACREDLLYMPSLD